MLNAILGRKIGMTQIFVDNGKAIPVTVIEAGPCFVTHLKTQATDGYEAVQIGYGTSKLKNASRAELGHLGHNLVQTPTQRARAQQQGAKARQEARAKQPQADEANVETQADEAASQPTNPQRQARARKRRGSEPLGPFEILREVQALRDQKVTVGQKVGASIFAQGEFVDIIGTTKGKGFAGVMKRHGFRGGKRTHGQSDRERAPGSIGAGTTPGRVFKGTRMAGHMGHVRNTVKSLEVIQTDESKNLLLVKGSIPGPNGGLVMIRKQVVM